MALQNVNGMLQELSNTEAPARTKEQKSQNTINPRQLTLTNPGLKSFLERAIKELNTTLNEADFIINEDVANSWLEKYGSAATSFVYRPGPLYRTSVSIPSETPVPGQRLSLSLSGAGIVEETQNVLRTERCSGSLSLEWQDIPRELLVIIEIEKGLQIDLAEQISNFSFYKGNYLCLFHLFKRSIRQTVDFNGQNDQIPFEWFGLSYWSKDGYEHNGKDKKMYTKPSREKVEDTIRIYLPFQNDTRIVTSWTWRTSSGDTNLIRGLKVDLASFQRTGEEIMIICSVHNKEEVKGATCTHWARTKSLRLPKAQKATNKSNDSIFVIKHDGVFLSAPKRSLSETSGSSQPEMQRLRIEENDYSYSGDHTFDEVCMPSLEGVRSSKVEGEHRIPLNYFYQQARGLIEEAGSTREARSEEVISARSRTRNRLCSTIQYLGRETGKQISRKREPSIEKVYVSEENNEDLQLLLQLRRLQLESKYFLYKPKGKDELHRKTLKDVENFLNVHFPQYHIDLDSVFKRVVQIQQILRNDYQLKGWMVYGRKNVVIQHVQVAKSDAGEVYSLDDRFRNDEESSDYFYLWPLVRLVFTSANINMLHPKDFNKVVYTPFQFELVEGLRDEADFKMPIELFRVLLHLHHLRFTIVHSCNEKPASVKRMLQYLEEDEKFFSSSNLNMTWKLQPWKCTKPDDR